MVDKNLITYSNGKRYYDFEMEEKIANERSKIAFELCEMKRKAKISGEWYLEPKF